MLYNIQDNLKRDEAYEDTPFWYRLGFLCGGVKCSKPKE